jgi:hypothetical protein
MRRGAGGRWVGQGAGAGLQAYAKAQWARGTANSGRGYSRE